MGLLSPQNLGGTIGRTVTDSAAQPAKFITFEGTEGSGKSLQMQRFCEFLRGRNLPFRHTFEPGGTRFGNELRQILLHSQGAPREPLAELLLYLADRYQHLKEVIEPALHQNLLVLSDRYHDATLAYQGYARGIGVELTDQIASLLQIPRPDVTVLFDLPVELGLERARRRNAETGDPLGRFEAEQLDFHRRVREGYLMLADREPQRFIVVDGQGSVDAVFERLKHRLLPRILP
ncbi:MAG: dTMP kinase [Acidobacteriota bacterium]